MLFLNKSLRFFVAINSRLLSLSFLNAYYRISLKFLFLIITIKNDVDMSDKLYVYRE